MWGMGAYYTVIKSGNTLVDGGINKVESEAISDEKNLSKQFATSTTKNFSESFLKAMTCWQFLRMEDGFFECLVSYKKR